MAAVEVPQTLEYRGGQLNATPVLEVENFTNCKKRFMCHIIGIEPQFENIIKNDPFIPMTVGQRKPENQWTGDERKAANIDHYKALMNELVNDGIKLSKLEINTNFINGLPKKWLSFCQSLRNTNNMKDYELASLFGKLKYEENLRDSIYETEKNKSLVFATPLSTTLFSSSIFQDFLDSPDDEEDTKSNHKFSSAKATDQTECHKCGKKGHFARDYWSKTSVSTYQSPFQLKPLSSPQHKPELMPTKDFEDKYNKVKAKLALLSSSTSASKAFMHVNTKILKENKNLGTELKELKAFTETWLNSSNKVNQCINEHILYQKKRIMGVDPLTEDPSSSGQKDLVYVKSSADDTNVTIPSAERPWLSEAKGFILPNHDTAPFFPPLKKLNGAEPIFGPKTIKSILRSKSTFKTEALKGVIINEPSSAPAKGNKNSLASKVHSAPAGKLKSVKIEDDPPLAIVMKELNNLKLQVSRNQSSYSKSEALQAKKDEALKSTRAESLNANRSKTPTKSQLYDAKYIIQFDEKRGTFFNSNKEVVMIAPIVRDVYVLNMTSSIQESCFFAKASENLNWLWLKRLAHLNFKTINKLAKQNLVIGLPPLVYSKDKPCSSCEKGKHHRTSLLTMKSTLFSLLMSTQGTPRNSILVNFCDDKGISQNFSSSYTLEQNGVVERKNRTLIEAARTMLSGSIFSKQYWTEAVATACYTQNKSTNVKRHLKTPYEIFSKRIPNISFLHVFGCPVYIHTHKDHLGKFNEKSYDGYLLGYSLVSKAFKVFNTRRQQTKETYHITFDESPDAIKFSKPSVDNINIAEIERYPPDKYIHPYEHS
ncbi:retrovirus-related pol polyprotein from transposon TNT 1-94 [Tanacetum coccineum]|uniref:Retrovirus-related pol polyprotein from transposon TNT 1-94 n=1 Tax=Tanacetum coccineum TaxID=301880 RepID=A0ABQ5G859_9ASTR